MILDGRKPEPEVLQEIIMRVVQIAHPQRLILFGSAARGEMGPQHTEVFLEALCWDAQISIQTLLQ